MPAAQLVHPLPALNVPAAQKLEHEGTPGAEYNPTEQLEQEEAPPVATYLFASQFVHELAPTVEYMPARQSEQLVDAAAPDDVPKVPVEHKTQLLEPVLL